MISPQWQLLKLFFYLENEHLKHVIFISLDGTTSLRFTLTRTRLQTVAITFWDTNKKKSPVRRSEKHTITAPQARRRRRKMVFLGENFDFFYFPPGSLSVWTPSPCLPAGKSPDADAILIWKRPNIQTDTLFCTSECRWFPQEQKNHLPIFQIPTGKSSRQWSLREKQNNW